MEAGWGQGGYGAEQGPTHPLMLLPTNTSSSSRRASATSRPLTAAAGSTVIGR